jgi:hypothetical protein
MCHWWETAKSVGEAFKVWAEFVAYSSAGAFLIYKVLSGYFITDLSVKISCERFTQKPGTDYVAVTAILKKGDKGTIRIHDAKVRITNSDGKVVDEQQMTGVDRLSFTTDRDDRKRINFDRLAEKKWLSLPPGDETQFAGLCSAPQAFPGLVEVVILGRKLWGGKVAQWRASAVSFPRVIDAL